VSRLAKGIVVSGVAMALLWSVMVVSLFMGAAGQDSGDDAAGSPYGCAVVVEAGGNAAVLDQEQITNARTIVSVGQQRQIPPYGWTIALATAKQESQLRNLDYGDRDSLGLFQQRPSAGWGSPTQIMDPVYSASKFYEHLVQVNGWQQLPVTVAAQAVQRSAFPFAYAKWESMAAALVRSITGKEPADCGMTVAASLPSGTVGDILRTALQQVGDPYVYAATGPDAFDCSGLVVYAWRQAGYQVPVRTAEQMRQISTPIAPGQEQPGDLVFSQFNTPRVPNGAGHIGIVLQKGVLIEAPRTGLDVRIRSYDSNDPGLQFGRFPGSELRPIRVDPKGTTT
jgi:cell wall-associated NlpC family hydrolase